tara:strand:- start:267 stop:932 length:666 start_codon:yes stop_codon:yes gene_type:complete
MKLNLRILILSIGILHSCKSEPKINFAEGFQDCLTVEDIIQLNKATAQFERKLNDTYGSENNNAKYLRYLKDFSVVNLNPKFMIDAKSKDILNDLKASGTFDKVWISIWELSTYKERNTESLIIEFEPKKTTTNIDIPRVDYIGIHPTGDFRKCLLLDNTIHNSLKDVIELQIKGPSLSYSLTSTSVANSMTAKDLDNNLNKVVIAMIFYYEMVHFTNQNL